MIDMSVDAFELHFKNPIMTCSGTFASGLEYSEFVDLNRLGAVVTKGVSHEPWSGNPTPRICETPSGMLNAVGLQNPGTELFINRDLKELKKYDTNIVVNVCGHSLEEYLAAVEDLNETEADVFEINISCPNVTAGGLSFGTDEKGVYEITKEIKRISKKPVIMKLTPNVTDIKRIAKAAEDGGADGISLINTITGMKIDVERQTFALANRTGGLSGPAIHPVAVRMVYECANTVNIPIIGMGGCRNYTDALEMILAGASFVAIGTANFNNPKATEEIIDGIEDYMIRHGISDIKSLVGAVK
jgi:dihydroorotate dehydrogenase (NAD+) catalytic subunit